MEKLARYSFTKQQCDEIVNDAKKLVTDAIQRVIGDVVAVVADNIANSIITSLEQRNKITSNTNNNILVEDSILEDESEEAAIKFIDENSERISTELQGRNQQYSNFVNTVATIDLFDEYLSEDPIYVPRKFRSDNRHCMTPDEREVVNRLSEQKFRHQIEILQHRRDEFRRRIKNGDETFNRFVRDNITDEEILYEVMTIWKTAIKVDEEKVDEIQIKKTESIRAAHQKDRDSRLQKPDNQQNEPTQKTPRVRFQSVTEERGVVEQSIPNLVVNLPQSGDRQIQNTTSLSANNANNNPQNPAAKNDQSQRKNKKRKKKNPPRLASSTYLTSISSLHT